MSYYEALAWLLGTQLFGIKLGLENIERLLATLAPPKEEPRIIHVAGTNGKGSVCAMIDAICRAQGYRTGLFTSPHLVTFRERIQVNGERISETEAAVGLTSLREQIAGWDPHPTFFEITTALALAHFCRRECEIVVLETGMGGRLDATSAVTPVVSVLTPVDYDHQKWLGHTLAEIAAEKAGIIKPRVPVVSAPQQPAAERVICETAAMRGAPLHFANGTYAAPVALSGKHQQQNAALAIAALEAAEVMVSKESIAAGLTSVEWPARFQRWNDRIVVDGAHNPAGARVAAETWRAVFGEEKATLILGLMRDKDAASVYRELAPVAAHVVLPCFRGPRALPPEELAVLIASISPDAEQVIAVSCAEALSIASAGSHRVLVAGSLHLAGEMLAVLGGAPAAFEECEQ